MTSRPVKATKWNPVSKSKTKLIKTITIILMQLQTEHTGSDCKAFLKYSESCFIDRFIK